MSLLRFSLNRNVFLPVPCHPSACADDGSAMFFQRAALAGTLIEPHGLTLKKCQRAL
jgi:hypothetical protein